MDYGAPPARSGVVAKFRSLLPIMDKVAGVLLLVAGFYVGLLRLVRSTAVSSVTSAETSRSAVS